MFMSSKKEGYREINIKNEKKQKIQKNTVVKNESSAPILCPERKIRDVSHACSYEPPPGAMVIGKNDSYKINERRLIGKGAFSSVYIGTSVNTNQIVAIKKVNYSALDEYEQDVIE